MDINGFGPNKTGNLIEISGYKSATHAFVPNSLPPDWQWPEELWPLLMKANMELARLDGIGQHLPNPLLLLTPLQNREAQRSSSLEGTISTPQQLALFEISADSSDLTTSELDAAKEVTNYARALRFHSDSQEVLPLSLRLIKELHKILLDNIHRSATVTPGEFRRGQVQIGAPARFIPPPANFVPACLDQLEKYLHAPKIYDPLVEAFLVHYQFETIHPFMDGNGRVGRLLLAITIKEWCGLSQQWLYMSAYFDRNKDDYLDRLFQVSANGRWGDWIAFCLEGVIQQAQDTQLRCSRLLALREDYHKLLVTAGCPGRMVDMVDGLFVSPAATATSVKDRYGVSHPTARADLEYLVQLGILTEIPLRQRRQKGYYCQDIFQITYGET